MSVSDRERWDEKYAKREPLPPGVAADDWLVESLRLIENADGPFPPDRRSLDIACGLGQNAIWLAQQSWQSDAVDVSANGLNLARQGAESNHVEVNWIHADLDEWQPVAELYDLVVVFRFLDRETVLRIVKTALKPGGWLIYETFSNAQCDRPDSHISNPAFTLAPGDFESMFPDLEMIVNREETLPDRTVRRFLGRRLPDN